MRDSSCSLWRIAVADNVVIIIIQCSSYHFFPVIIGGVLIIGISFPGVRVGRRTACATSE